jgi:peptidyl-prolyl cis-trans isomerase A (cyclophilin A)
MQRAFALVGVLCLASLFSWSWSQTAPAAKPATAHAPRATGPTAVIDTTVGKMKCELFPNVAPIGVANFIGLANGTKDWVNPITHTKKHGVPLYDGTIFHRVIPEFMIQGGDPAGTGEGDPGYTFKDEVSPTVKFDRAGRLAYANSGANTNGSQFFITEQPLLGRQGEALNGHYTIFGQCDEASVVLVKQVARMGRDANDRPYRPVKITHITVTQSVTAAKPATATKPAGTAAKPPVKTPAKPAATPK